MSEKVRKPERILGETGMPNSDNHTPADLTGTESIMTFLMAYDRARVQKLVTREARLMLSWDHYV